MIHKTILAVLFAACLLSPSLALPVDVENKPVINEDKNQENPTIISEIKPQPLEESAPQAPVLVPNVEAQPQIPEIIPAEPLLPQGEEDLAGSVPESVPQPGPGVIADPSAIPPQEGEGKSDLETANTFWGGWGGRYYRQPHYYGNGWGGYGGYGGYGSGWRRGYGGYGYGRGYGGWGGWGWGGGKYWG